MNGRMRFLPLACLVLVILWLRLINLGYSDYQGDEIKALSLLKPGQSLTEFLLEQRKGPVQFLITYGTRFIDPNYSNELLHRLPFALAGILSVFFLYQLVKLHFGGKIALLSGFFMATNGIFVAFSRIVQYQSFVILFSILTLYAFSLAIKHDMLRITGVYMGMLLWAAAILTHYDGIFIAPFVVYILYRWYQKYPSLSGSRKIAQIGLAGVICGLIIASFYVPFLFSISRGTKEYWFSRLYGGEIDKLSSSVVTFRIYNPHWAIYFYVTFGLLALSRIRQAFPVLLWFFFPWLVFETVISVPGTHIYTYLIPGFVLMAFGLLAVEERLTAWLGERSSKRLGVFGFTIVILLLFSLSHTIFVDHSQEYPWQVKRFWLWTLEKPDTRYHLSIFGFPYDRNWEAIGAFVRSDDRSGYYATNEKEAIVRYYVPLESKIARAGYFFLVHSPQSFNRNKLPEKASYWVAHYEPIRVFEKDGRVMVEIYDMPQGSLKEIREAGY